MNIHTISSSKRDADIQLKAMKRALSDLSTHCEGNDIDLSSAIKGYIHSETELINKMLGD